MTDARKQRSSSHDKCVLARHIDAKYGAEFANELPAIRRQLGATPFEQRKEGFFGVAGNTFRAFRNKDTQPSVLFAQWGSKLVSTLDAQVLSTRISTREDFLDWHEELSSSLKRLWKRYETQPLSTAHQFKLIDLFVKWLSRHRFEGTNLPQQLAAHANCAIDRQTLVALNLAYSNALPLGTPSMANVSCKAAYDFCQDAIGMFTRKYGGTRLLFDYFVWRRGG